MTDAAPALSMPTKPGFERHSAASQAALYIRRLIFDGDLPPGSRVHQDQVARALDISRIPVREALIGLEREGWVSSELNRGAFVNAFDEAAVLDHYALYGVVHGRAARWALQRADREALAGALRAIVAEIESERPTRSFSDLAMDFHRRVLGAAGSRPILTVSTALSWLVPGDFFELVPGAQEQQRRWLPVIASAIEAGDGDGAAGAYESLMSENGAAVLALFESRGLIA